MAPISQSESPQLRDPSLCYRFEKAQIFDRNHQFFRLPMWTWNFRNGYPALNPGTLTNPKTLVTSEDTARRRRSKQSHHRRKSGSRIRRSSDCKHTTGPNVAVSSLSRRHE
jgi:hypothetical protein